MTMQDMARCVSLADLGLDYAPTAENLRSTDGEQDISLIGANRK